MSKVQLNLVPDIKMTYINAERTRKTLVSISVLVGGVAFAIFLLMIFTVDIVQKKQLSDASKNLTAATTKLKSISNLDQILTVQNQLQALTGLHQSKHAASRIFIYLPQVTPTNASIGDLKLDLAGGTLEIDGTADSQKTVNTFIDTLKFTTFTAGANTPERNAFPSVVETSLSFGASNVSYTLSIKFDPILFNNNVVDSNNHTVVPALKVPNLTTTRSVLEDPANGLFNGQFKKSTGAQ
ncbi:MAG TPA: PilN domain-containing protein [Candidatus Saccharimonadales bacterium]|nr:PilN domain-containing protein [Candidatus Saccharimonadales bacterium]